MELQTRGVGRSREVEGKTTQEVPRGVEERVSIEERDVMTRGRRDEGRSEMITWVPVRDPCEED